MREEHPTEVEMLVQAAICEDLNGDGDVTSRYFVSEEARGKARIFAKEDCRLSGVTVAARVFQALDHLVDTELVAENGALLKTGDTVLTIEGSLRTILTGERSALNFLQHLSGVATLTEEFVSCIEGTNATLLDTRKTTPGYRALEKQAVAHGGGTNHRMGLYDHVMVKDNHLLAEPDLERIPAVIEQLKIDYPNKRIQLEADTIQQLQTFLGFDGVDSVLLDNMPPETLREAVELRDVENPKVKLEASGGVNLESIRAIAESGVDFVSVGALTHSAVAVD
ncbi:MAG: carboxylating nicotinate-nucleotide diphosphorylase, partial [Verrucomicrobiota bacterium]